MRKLAGRSWSLRTETKAVSAVEEIEKRGSNSAASVKGQMIWTKVSFAFFVFPVQTGKNSHERHHLPGRL